MVDDCDNSPSRNPFIRFRHSVDNTVRRGLDTFTNRRQTQDPPASEESTPDTEQITPVQPVAKSPRLRLIIPDPDKEQLRAHSRGSMAPRHGDFGVTRPADDFDSFPDPESWARHSPYSPFNLQHLPQPVPRDIPQAKHNDFTFRDAFEDLMLASSGRPLPGGPELMASKLHVDFMFANGMPIPNWVRMLDARDMWQPYFQRQQRFHSWENDIASLLLNWGIDAGWLPGDEAAKTKARVEEERLKSVSGSHETPHDQVATREPENDHFQPDTEQDMYGRADPRGHGKPRYQSPWDMMVEALNEARTSHPPGTISTSDSNTTAMATRTDNIDEPKEPKETEKTESRKTWDGGRVDKVWKSREYNGKIETTETRFKYDAGGNLVSQWESTKIKSIPTGNNDEGYSSSSSSSSSKWSRTWSWGNGEGRHGWDCPKEVKARRQDHSQQDETSQKEFPNDRKSPEAESDEKTEYKPAGWFWTK